MLKTVTVELESTSAMSHSKRHYETQNDNETFLEHKARTFRAFLHTNTAGYVVIPPMMLKNTWAEAAKFQSMQVPGKGKATYTKHFDAGILVTEPAVLPLLAKDVESELLFLPGDCTRGGGKRIEKIYPVIHKWSATAFFHVMDPVITEDVFAKVSDAAGSFIGFGRFRPRQGGFYGRFRVKSLHWS